MTAKKLASDVTPATALAARRAGLLLFSGEEDVGSHWVRVVLAEKDVDGVATEWVKAGEVNEDWMTLSPDRVLPTLADREVVLYPARLAVEYLDERYPHPPLLPVEPGARARVRMVLHHIESQLYELAGNGAGQSAAAQKARKALREELLGVSRMFPARGYFMGNDLSMVDTAWAPLMWRLPSLGIALDAVDGMRGYAERLFARGAFQRSLSAVERSLAA